MIKYNSYKADYNLAGEDENTQQIRLRINRKLETLKKVKQKEQLTLLVNSSRCSCSS